MNKARLMPVVIVILLALIIILFASGVLFVDPIGPIAIEDASPEQLTKLAGYFSSVNSSVSNVASMLLSVQFGTFVIIGFLVKDKVDNFISYSVPEIIFIFIFLISSSLSIYYDFMGRMQVLQIINLDMYNFRIVEKTLGQQALYVLISAASAISAICFSIRVSFTSNGR